MLGLSISTWPGAASCFTTSRRTFSASLCGREFLMPQPVLTFLFTGSVFRVPTSSACGSLPTPRV